MNVSSLVKVTKGIISSLTGIGNNLAEMQIDTALQSGNSGCPILDEYGNVVGVAVAKLDVKFALEKFGAIPENTNCGVKANIVEVLLDANGVVYQQGKSEKPPGTEFSNMLSSGTYYISCWMTLAQIEAMKTKKVIFTDLQQLPLRQPDAKPHSKTAQGLTLGRYSSLGFVYLKRLPANVV